MGFVNRSSYEAGAEDLLRDRGGALRCR
jgi:hypothetical protein